MRSLTAKASSKLVLSCGTAIAALMAAQPAMAQTTSVQTASIQVPGETDPATEENEPAKDIIVLGTRRTDRSVTDSASPVDVIGGGELSTQPASDMLDVVKNLVPSFYVPQNTISDASTFVRAPSLRGLGADQILVMVNGKRYNRSALVQVYVGGDTALSFGSQGSDISLIPTIAIKNLQVLRDGATAQYGSDAIGGVINYTLRDDAGLELQARYGETYRGDGKSYQVAGNFGFKLGDAGFVNLSGEYFDDGQTSRGATRPLALEFERLNPSLASQLPNYPGPVQIWGSSPSNGYKLMLNSALEVGGDNRIYFTGNLAHREANQSFNYRSPISAPTPLAIDNGTGTPATASPGRNGSFNPIYLTPCPTGNPTCPAGGFVKDANTFSFASIYPAGFTPRFLGVVDEAYGTVGFRGKAPSGLTYDVSGTLARNSLDLAMTSSLNSSFGPASQQSFKFGKLIQSETNLNLDLTYPIQVGFASAITLSGGAEYRREQYEATAGDEQSYAAGPFASQALFVQTAPGVYTRSLTTAGAPETATQSPGASGYGGTSPASANKYKQSNYGVYVGAEADVIDALTLGVAGRYEHYDTFGSAYVGKLSALYRVTEGFSVRGTVGTGFHAPSPGQNNVQILTTNFVAGNQVQTGTYPVTSPIAQYYGSRSLKPEKSTNFGAGFILTPVSAVTLTVDGYSIKVRNRIGITQNFSVTAADVAAEPALAAVGVGGVVNYFTNGFDTRTNGVDAVGSYRTNLAGSPLNLTLAYNYNKSKVIRSVPGTISAAQIINVSNLAPRHRAIFSAGWRVGDISVNARQNFYSSWRNETDYPGQKFGAKFTTDFDVSYTLAERYTLTLGAYNLFNEYPDRISPTTANPIFDLTESTADGQIYPRTGGPFGINGGFLYARLRVKY